MTTDDYLARYDIIIPIQRPNRPFYVMASVYPQVDGFRYEIQPPNVGLSKEENELVLEAVRWVLEQSGHRWV